MIYSSLADLISGQTLVTIMPGAGLSEACTLLSRHNIGALPVVEDSRLVGIVSERDIIARALAEHGTLARTRVADVMTHSPVTLPDTASLADAQQKMREGGFRHLPVTNTAGWLIGMVSLRDIPTEYRLMAERFHAWQRPVAAAE